MFSRKRWCIGVISVLFVVSMAVLANHTAISLCRLEARDPATAVGKPAPALVKVQIIQPKKSELRRISTQRVSLEPFESVRLFARVPGYLKSQFFDIGDRVQRGQRLAALDVPELESQIRYDEAAVEQARARVVQAKARIKSEAAQLEAARLAVPQAEANVKSSAAVLQYRENHWKRMKNLSTTGAIQERLVDESKAQYDAAVEAERSARAAVATAKANIAASTAKSERAEAGLAVTEAGVKMAMAKLDKSKVQLSFATITAPMDGIVVRRGYHVGDFIRSANEGTNQHPIATVQRIDQLRVVVMIPERHAPFIETGTKAALDIDAFPKKQWSIKVSRVAAIEDLQTRSMRAEFDLPNPTGQLRPGLSGAVTIDLGTQKDVLSIPFACLAGKVDDRQATVYVVRDGRARRVAVQIGSDDGQRVEIRSGLTPEDQVIFQPAKSLSDGAEVTPTTRKE